jgi:flagellar protein FliS
MHNAAYKYLETQVTTTNQGELLILLYDGAIKFLNQAKEKIALKDYAGKGILISKALDIVNELTGSLNKDRGGDLAEQLGNLYFYCNSRLLQANLKMDAAIIEEVVNILSGLRNAYAEILNSGAASPGIPSVSAAPVGKPSTAPAQEPPEATASAGHLSAVPSPEPAGPAESVEAPPPPKEVTAPQAIRRRLVHGYGK